MARLDYEENQSIHSMNTRQLRKYIADQAEEAQKRLDSAPKERSRAFDELVSNIEGRTGKVKKSTSYMSKAEMREYAYTLRTFNRFDTESEYYNRTDWEKNKSRYEKFIKNQIDKKGKEHKYWKKYVLPSGEISQEGYQEYKDFISVLSASEEYLNDYGYRTIQKYAQDSTNNLDPDKKILNKTLAKVYLENKSKGLTQGQLIDKFAGEYDKALGREQEKRSGKPVKATTKKAKKTSSKSNIKAKKAGKMRTSGRVHNKLN